MIYFFLRKKLIEQKETVFTVTELTNRIKNLLESEFAEFPFTLEGEISNYRPSSSGHIYFTLKDDKAAIKACLFRGNALKLAFTPKDGMMVRVKGSISVYPPQGSYQIIVSRMEQAGVGDILQMLEERKRRLAMEGLFDEESKVNLPFFPTTIGVVTSPTGAALQDILNITKRRNPLVNVLVLPCSVQGQDAASQIAAQIRYANAHQLCDVLIVGRGGGSLEDLLPFSEEIVVRAVAESSIPTVSAVGHEIDWAISDFAADRRAPTPSAAAELCTPLLSDITNYIHQVKNQLSQTIESKISNCKLLIKSFTPESLEMSFRTIEQPYLLRFDDVKEQLLENIYEKMENVKKRIENAKIILDASNPKLILARGYAMVRDKETGKIITKASSVKSGQILEIVPESGTINVTVNSTTN